MDGLWLLKEHGGSISCRYNHWKGFEWFGMDWRCFELEEPRNWGFCARTFERPFEHSNVGIAKKWLGLNVRALKPAGVLAWSDVEFEHSFWTFERVHLWVIWRENVECSNVHSERSNVGPSRC